MGERLPTSGDPQQSDLIDVEILAVGDDSDEDIDWDQLTREAHADFEAGNFNFISTHEDPSQARMALKKYLDEVLEEVLRETAATPRAEIARS